MKDVSIIIVNYNTYKYTINCIKSIIENSYGLDIEIIVIDNGSREFNLEEIKKMSKMIFVTRNDNNEGFSSANNKGIQLSTGKYILLLNNDTIILPNTLQLAKSYMDQNPLVGILGCKLLNPDYTLQPSIVNYPRVFNDLLKLCIPEFFRKNTPKKRAFISNHLKPLTKIGLGLFYNANDITYVEIVVGAFMFTRREALNEIGLLDEGFFFMVEEADWCYRFMKNGWKICYFPAAKIIHYGGAALNQEFPGKYFVQMYKSRLYYYQKHLSKANSYLFIFGVSTILFIKVLLMIAILPVFDDQKKKKQISKLNTYKRTIKMLIKPSIRKMNVLENDF
ncbi:MAG: glycosyltransferase family 2 protein [candidate division KSB1 bacterium]|nr:glycosyltransferase family 2 protein [candidate division KSB1 bacterium]